jgi:hypothetical protein
LCGLLWRANLLSVQVKLQQRVPPRMIRISITSKVFEAIVATLPWVASPTRLKQNAKGERPVWLEERLVDEHARPRREREPRDHPVGGGRTMTHLGARAPAISLGANWQQIGASGQVPAVTPHYVRTQRAGAGEDGPPRDERSAFSTPDKEPIA